MMAPDMRSLLIISAGICGCCLVQALTSEYQVTAIDHDEEQLNRIRPYVFQAIQGDSCDKAFLASLNIEKYAHRSAHRFGIAQAASCQTCIRPGI